MSLNNDEALFSALETAEAANETAPVATVEVTEIKDSNKLTDEFVDKSTITEGKPKADEAVSEAVSEEKPKEETIVVKEEDIKAEAAKILQLEEEKETVSSEPVYDQAYLDYKDYLKDPQVVALIEARKNGKSITDLVKDITAEDPSKLTQKETYEKHLDSFGLTGEEKEIELEKFDGMSPLERAQITKPIKEKLTNDFNQKLEQLINPIKQEKEIADRAIEQAAKEGNQKLDSLLAQDEFMGLELTAERKKALRTFVENNCYPNKKGEYNVEYTFKAGILENFGADLVKANTKKAETKAKEEVFKEITRPSKEVNSTSAASLAGDDNEDIYSLMKNSGSRDL